MMTEKSKELICTPCALQFDKKVVFDLHISLVHETAKSESGEALSAIEENQDFVLASEAIQKISCKTSAPFPCESCDKNFTLKINLKRHIKSIHEENRSFKCTVCEKTFKQKSNLKIHFSSVHEKKKVIISTPTVKKLREKKSCNWVFENGIVCRKTFHKTCNLKVHMQMHRGIKPFQCYFCGQNFRQNSNLKNHKMTHFRNDLDQADHEYIFQQSNLAMNDVTTLQKLEPSIQSSSSEQSYTYQVL